MKKAITSLLLILALLFNVISFSACEFFNSDHGKDDTPKAPREPLNIDVDAMLNGKYADFEISREKLEYALEEAIKKIDYALLTFIKY